MKAERFELTQQQHQKGNYAQRMQVLLSFKNAPQKETFFLTSFVCVGAANVGN